MQRAATTWRLPKRMRQADGMRKPRGSMNEPRSGSLAGTSTLRCLRRVSTWPQVPRRTPSGWSTWSRVARAAGCGAGREAARRYRHGATGARAQEAATTAPLPDQPSPERPAPEQPGRASRPRRRCCLQGAPRTVALLLPLTGRHRAIGTAVRDGFVAACLADPADVRPRVTIYDTAATRRSRLLSAGGHGGRTVHCRPADEGRTPGAGRGGQFPFPRSALNTLRVAFRRPSCSSFRSTRARKRAVAQRIAADGHLRGVALFPENDWGRRVHEAFEEELERRVSR